MAYTRLHWVESETPLSADNFNNIEDGIEELQSQKVDKVSGKALSDQNYTAVEKTKLAGIAEGAEVNVQPDWDQTNTSADDYIKNKPGNASSSTAGFMTAADKTKLDGVQAGAQVNPGVATTSANGLMSSSDKTKINGIETGATKTPDIKVQGSSVTDDKLNIVFSSPLTVTEEQTAVPGTTTTTETIGISNATTSAPGLMTAADKTKLNGIATGATKNTDVATTSANGLMSSTDKTKLNGIETGATKNTITKESISLGSSKTIRANSSTSLYFTGSFPTLCALAAIEFTNSNGQAVKDIAVCGFHVGTSGSQTIATVEAYNLSSSDITLHPTSTRVRLICFS